MNLQRLRTMTIGELTCRSRLEASKWLERVGLNGHRNGGPEAVFGKLVHDPALIEIRSRVRGGDLRGAEQMLLNHFEDSGPERFFAGAADDQVIALMRRRMPSICDAIVAAADQICQGRFDLLGYSGLSFGDPIDWHLDPIGGCRTPLVHWSRIRILEPAARRENKVIWELNRHQWLLSLGQAYRLTREHRYAGAFAAYVEDWIRANPPGSGINWQSSLELALRILSWSWALHLFRGSEALTAELFASLLEQIFLHARHIEKYLSYYYAPNTHLTGEALGLFYAGVLFPGLKRAGHWRKLGARILVEQSEKQILSDGVYFEQSACYHRYTVEIYLHFMILAARTRIAIPAALEGRVQKMIDFLLYLRRPDGSMPQIGDGDGGWLLPLAPREPGDLRGLFSAAAALFGRADYAWAAGGPAPETLWLLGASALPAYEAIPARPPAARPSRAFAEGGYVVMRSSWDSDAHQLIFDTGSLGAATSGHGHADLLSIQCAVFGEPFLIDPGTYCYTAEPKWRDFFRGSAAHSTVMVDDEPQAIPAGPFQWQGRPSARLRRWLSTAAYDLADAEHDTYCRLPDPVTHRRRVAFIRPRCWLVVDDLQGASEHRVELRFQFAPMEVSLEPGFWVRGRGARGHGLLIKSFAIAPLEREVVQGRFRPIGGWVSPDYGQLCAAPLLIYRTLCRLPLRVVTLLLPVQDASAPAPAVSLLVGGDLLPAGLILGEGERLFVTEEKILISPGG